jgi:hypothetical protein
MALLGPQCTPPSTLTCGQRQRQCAQYATATACTAGCGCGWCSNTSTCVAANLTTGYPEVAALCPAAFAPSYQFISWMLPTVLPRVLSRDMCADIPPDRCTSFCGCGLCDTSAYANDPSGRLYGVCMSQGATNVVAASANACPAYARWNTAGSGLNNQSCVSPTAVADPCSAYPADAAGTCTGHCGCGYCANPALNGAMSCASGTATGVAASITVLLFLCSAVRCSVLPLFVPCALFVCERSHFCVFSHSLSL